MCSNIDFRTTANYPTEYNTQSWGLMTGSVDFGDDFENRYEVYYYDNLGRMIQNCSESPEGSTVRSLRHTYTGAVEAERTTVQRPDTTLTFETVSVYDMGERPLSIRHSLGNGSVTIKPDSPNRFRQ